MRTQSPREDPVDTVVPLLSAPRIAELELGPLRTFRGVPVGSFTMQPSARAIPVVPNRSTAPNNVPMLFIARTPSRVLGTRPLFKPSVSEEVRCP
jgi:hypothetical protein